MSNDVNLNLDPSSLTMSLRHLSRIQRLRIAAGNPRNSARRKDLEDEIARRSMLLSQNKITVPEDDNGLRDAIDQVTSELQKVGRI